MAEISNDLQWAIREVRAEIAKSGIDAQPGNAQQFAGLNARERERWGKVVRAANIKVE